MSKASDASIQFIPSSTHISMPWKNGGGQTVEIFSYPLGSTMENFEWRLSMAHVETDGPFSVFPNIHRTLCVLDGNAMTLDIEGIESPQILTPKSAPLSFAADAPTHATLQNGSISDLNIMTRNQKWTHHVNRMNLRKPQKLDLTATVSIIFAQTSGISVQAGKSYSLTKHDCLIIPGPRKSVFITPENQQTILLLTLNKVLK